MSDPNQDGTTPAAPQPATPPPYAAPQPYGAPPVYGAPPAYAPPPAYGTPPAYGAAPSHGAPPAYGTPPVYGATPAYGTAPYYGGYAVVKTNVLAVISMIASIAGFVWILPFVGSVAGVIMGHISLRQIAANGEKGRGMALAGLIVGYVGLAFFVLGIIWVLFWVGIAASQGSSYSS